MGDNSKPITLNKYLYANANPTNMIDPTGNISIGSLMSAVGTVARLVTTATVNVARSVASRVNGQSIRVVGAIKTRIWLTKTVGKVQSRLPREFGRGRISSNNKGWRWSSGSRNNVRVQKGDPRSPNPAQQQDYVKLTVDGRVVG